MAAPPAKQLVVEGPNDYHAILHLLLKSGVFVTGLDDQTSPLSIKALQGKQSLLDDMPERWKESGRTAIGYVLDADGYLQNDGSLSGDPPGCTPTWQAISYRFQNLGVVDPLELKSDGFVGQISSNGPRIGVWIMPNNQAVGAIEEFLCSLTSPANALFIHARHATSQARTKHAAEFPEAHRSKAELACWLAWQEEPAMTYGQAMSAGKFDFQLEPANSFIRWIRRLFDL